MHNKNGWITVSKTPKQYDLLKLYQQSITELLIDTRLEVGTYDQIRLLIEKILVVKKNGELIDAKLPSKELKINAQLLVSKNENAGVVFDFLTSKSLHTTGDGKYIFAPVISLETKSDVTIQNLPNNRVEIVGGISKFMANVGMNEEGNMKMDFIFEPYTELKIVNGAIKVVTQEEKNIVISAETALDNAIKNGKIDSAISIKTFTRDNQLVWRITGKKDTAIVIVYINVTNGEIVAVE